jgi:hypothetical protein
MAASERPTGIRAVLLRVRKWRHPEGWDDSIRVFAALTFVAACWLFAHLATAAPRGDYLPLEQEVMQWFREAGTGLTKGPDWIFEAMRDITALGAPW